tara:strand:+ start:3782 stop:4273 length:492 start_codon:yes stop_codon:yes gene_type:complete
MPQLATADFVPQLVWLAITFIALYLAMWRVAIPRIVDVLEERQRRIDDDLMRAESLKREADEALAAYEEALGEARANAQRTASETRDAIKKHAADREAELDEALAKENEAASSRIRAAQVEAQGNIREIAIDAARAVTQCLIGTEPDDGAVGAAVDAALEGNR